METVERNLSRKDHCPKCGCSTVVITQLDEQEWHIECKHCHEGPVNTVSKRQAKIAWRLFARGEEVSDDT